MDGRAHRRKNLAAILIVIIVSCLFASTSCAPRIVQVSPTEGTPATVVHVSMEYLVGWPRVEIGTTMMDWPQLKLMAAEAARKEIPGEELVWIEDKVLQFKIPDLPPGEYDVTIHDDKGPPGDLTYSFLETTAYVIFPPVWPFVFRSNQAQFKFRVLPQN
jgi:hypothetical protein